jgi:hypothetical protein
MHSIQTLPQQTSHKSHSLKGIARNVVKAAKEHNKNVNSAYEQYYGLNWTPASSKASANVQH